jgi:aminoglycoside phosphotransferase (APT) family kinase protein
VVELPDFPAVSAEAVAAIGRRHGLGATRATRLPERGIFNAIFRLGPRHVLRVPRDHPAHFAALSREAAVVPAARAAGVRTPALVAYDTSCDLLPVPFVIYERVAGRDLGALDLEPPAAAAVWRELGVDMARLHLGVRVVDLEGDLPEHDQLADPRELAERRASEGWFTSSEARWLQAWLEQLAPSLATTPRQHCLHGDSQSTNVMVGVRSGVPHYRAVVDWGSAAWGDPAFDFAGVPLRAAPFMLEGYRRVSAPYDDATAEARILWRHLQLSLYLLGRGPMPRWSWAERPLPMLLDVMRFFLDPPGGVWAALGPR